MSIDNDLAKRLENVRGLPSPPRVAMRILDAARDPNISLAKVADVVTADPVIAAKIMRMANSAAYARPGGCQTLRQALILLGLDSTLIVALSFSLVMTLRRDQNGGFDHEYYWRRSLLAAAAASALGHALHRNDREALFLAALLQDIGMLAIDKVDPELYKQADTVQRDHRALAEFERECLGTDHAEIGAWLMSRWQLPDVIVDSISTSHMQDRNTKDEFAKCIALSGPLAEVWLSSDWSLSFRELVSMAVDTLGMDHLQIGAVLDELRKQIPEVEAMFEKDLVPAAANQDAMDEAREMLMQRGVDAFVNQKMSPTNETTPGAPVTLLRLQHRSELNDVLDKEFRAALANDADVGVILAGIDGLDHIRETCGAETADRMLRETALVMLDNAGTRVVGQFAHNELVLWLENYNLEATQLAGRRILRQFQRAMIEIAGETGAQIALALGIVSMDHKHRYDDAVQLMDEAQAALENACFGSYATPATIPDKALHSG